MYFGAFAIVAICIAGGAFAVWTVARMINNWIMAKHGYPLKDQWGRQIIKDEPTAARKIDLLTNQNEGLNTKVSRLEERIAVLERIVTDKPGLLSEEIESLRSKPFS